MNKAIKLEYTQHSGFLVCLSAFSHVVSASLLTNAWLQDDQAKDACMWTGWFHLEIDLS